MAEMEYKCPACGGALNFDTQTQKLKCPYCDSTYELSQFQNTLDQSEEDMGSQADEQSELVWNVHPGEEWSSEEQEKMDVYSCNSCGGEIVCDKTTTSAKCPYCDNPIVFKEKLSGMLKPDYVIPFKLDKRAAKETLKKYVDSKKLVPSLFKSENHIDEIKGVYIPFWIFDASVTADIIYTGEKTRAWKDSEYKYVEHSHFDILRAGDVVFDHVPVDGSEKMADDLMQSIEPFDFNDAVSFQSAYLAGYMADKYDVGANESIAIANERIKKSTIAAFDNTVNGFVLLRTKSCNVNLSNGEAKYALYPVWLLNTKWKDKTYTFAMNGQTGKFVGDLPLDKGAYWKKFGKMTGIFSVIGSVVAILVDLMV